MQKGTVTPSPERQKMESERLKREYRKILSNGSLAEALGTVCANCGSTDNIEYHHIVPLFLGGTNSISNIVPLCNRCHKVAHRGQHMSHYQNLKNSGRKSKVTDEQAFAALDKWADGQIGNKKCAELMGIKRSGVINMHDLVQYKKWCEIHGYKSVKNILDLRVITSSYPVEEEVYVVFIDRLNSPWYRATERVCFHDTGENDDVLYKVRGSEVYESFSEIQKKRRGG